MRDHLDSYDQAIPVGYEMPAGSMAETADPEAMKRDLGTLPDTTIIPPLKNGDQPHHHHP